MGLFNFWNNSKSGEQIDKNAPSPKGATENAAAPADELKKEIEKKGLDASKIEISVEGDKVKLGGKAPSTSDAEKIVLAVGNTKGVSQVESNIVVGKQETESFFYKVRQGDTLWKIAETQYGQGKGGKYEEIFAANRPLLSDPDKIYPGQVLRIPKAQGAAGQA
ncbi:LysM domain-containing protein [Methylosinus sp. sav-2]|uniref:peptidoglycan-binding protein LysM n=1 Tax=Methylosinus sp. sav-2 TaxID=2485168 RepID=UPI00047B8A46|nr:peptidoglycan-binding protein LysM [Methylosinus sp. sav-2]TDX67452.1 LysM domain-containing protein [Methylosinus sp. sav-2]